MKNKDTIKQKILDEAGITLIALVVTIVVLIILATISINVVFSEDGIINKAEKAKEMYGQSSKQEELDLDNLSKEMNWDLSIVYGKKDPDGNLIPIPEGFYYVEGKKDTGFVISDSKTDENNPGSADGNQFVWVPVDNPDDYKLISWNGEAVAEEKTPNTYYWKSSIKDVDMEKSMESTSLLDTKNIAIEKLSKSTSSRGRINRAQDDAVGIYRDYEKESIEKYGGFYIGRYETSYDEVNKVKETKKNKVPYVNVGYSSTLRDTLLAQGGKGNQETLLRHDTNQGDIKIERIRIVQHNMMSGFMATGRQWDAMIKWLNETNGTGYNAIGHKGTSMINTGSNEEYKVNNIYDIAGNVSEYVDEAYGLEETTTYGLNPAIRNYGDVYRGANYSSETLSANMRNHNDGSASPVIGTRMSIILGLERSNQSVLQELN